MQVTRHCAVTYRIYPDKAQAGLIDRTIGCARDSSTISCSKPASTRTIAPASHATPRPPSTRTSIRSYAKWTVSHYATPN